MPISLTCVVNLLRKCKHHIQQYIYIVYIIRSRLKQQLKSVNSLFSLQTCSGKRVLVTLIETQHYHYHVVLLIAKALQLRGAFVKVLVCNEYLQGCEIKSIKNSHDSDPCRSCRLNLKHLLPLYGLDIVYLSEILPHKTIEQTEVKADYALQSNCSVDVHGISLDQSIKDSVVRYFYGAVPNNESQVKLVRRSHISTAILTTEIAYHLDQSFKPHSVLSTMPCYSAWEGLHLYFKMNGNRSHIISMNPFDFNTIKLDSYALYGSTDRFKRYLECRSSKHSLNNNEMSLLDYFMEARSLGKSSVMQRDQYFADSNESVASILGIDISKTNIFVFTNIHWDVGLSDNGALYSDVVSFAINTIELLRDHPDVHVYLKPHPGEVYTNNSLGGISSIVKNHFSRLPANLTIIEPELKVNTYDLFPFISKGVIFTGTLGLEMMLSGIPVISTGKTAHYGLGLAAEPADECSYLNLLLGKDTMPIISRKHLELFAYFYFIRTGIPFDFVPQVYGKQFSGFTLSSLNSLLPSESPILDHICEYLINPNYTSPESWPSISTDESHAL